VFESETDSEKEKEANRCIRMVMRFMYCSLQRLTHNGNWYD